MLYIGNFLKKNNYFRISEILKRRINIDFSTEILKLITDILRKDSHMMLSLESNKKIREKKKLFFKFLKNNDIISKSLVSCYIIYFIVLSYLLKNVDDMNCKLRNDLLYCSNEINDYLDTVNKLKLNNINYQSFLEKKYNLNINSVDDIVSILI